MSGITNFEKGTNYIILAWALDLVWDDKTMPLLTRMKVCGRIQNAIAHLIRTDRA